MLKKRQFSFLLFLIILPIFSFHLKPNWGFFGHKRINRMAVFTLPAEMILFYKKNIEYITSHAVDPDKRRYATKHEAVRHYIDLDKYGKAPFDNLPRDWTRTLIKYTDVFIINNNADTIQIINHKEHEFIDNQLILNNSYFAKRKNQDSFQIPTKAYFSFFINNILPNYYEDEWLISCDSIHALAKKIKLQLDCQSVFAKDNFSHEGIVPYHLQFMQKRLTKAFSKKDISQILRLSAEFGHYIGDAHVPLHTTSNYNGQLTKQNGIHGFWESRIPELYADKSYDYFVGTAEYIDDPQTYFWNIVLESHSLVDSVLAIEKSLSISFPEDQQYCYEERNNRTIRTYCKAYAKAFRDRMKGMVEKRMQASIHAIGSAWYTAWVDAGQPDLDMMNVYTLSEKERDELKKQEELFQRGEAKGRVHEN